MMNSYYLAVIGGGSAGLTAATIAARVGAKVLLIDKQTLGGECLNYGCVPSKALLKCAKVAHLVQTSSRFGVTTGPIDIDFTAVMDHVRGAIAKVGEGDSVDAMKSKGVDVALGGARFISPNHLQVGDREVTAKKIIISTGSRAATPPIPGLKDTGYLNNESLFSLREMPPRMVVIGGGPIGVEMGQGMARLGSKVTIIQDAERIMLKDDPDLSILLQDCLQKDLKLSLNSKVVRVSANNGVKQVEVKTGDKLTTIECDEILLATGRRPSLEDLDLEKAGVDFDGRGIKVDETLRTTASNIWACGDCVGSFQFTHFAEAQARIATRNALFVGSSKFKETVVPWVTFTDPELAHVGLTEEQARLDGRQYSVYSYKYDELDRAVCEGETEGAAKIICAPNGKILGASLLGHGAGEAIAEVVVAMKAGIKIGKLGTFIHVYPTMNRIIRRLSDQKFIQNGISNFTQKVLGRF